MNKLNRIVLLVVMFIFPVFAFAARDVSGILGTVKGLLDLVIPIVITIAVIYFFYGLAQYILNAHETGKKEEGRNIMIYGLVALFVMVSVWGLIGVLQTSLLGSTGAGTINLPTVGGSN